MKGYVVEQSLAAIAKGDGDDFARHLVQTWQKTNGLLTDDFNVDLERLVMLDAPQPGQPSPDILYCGENALASKVIGRGWLDEPTKAETFKQEFRALVGQHYLKAQSTETPVFDLVSAPTFVNGNQFDFRYERLILPVRTLAGALFLYCYSFAPGVSRRMSDPLPSEACRHDQPQQNRHLASPPAWEECAIQSLVGRPSSNPNEPHIHPEPYQAASSHR